MMFAIKLQLLRWTICMQNTDEMMMMISDMWPVTEHI